MSIVHHDELPFIETPGGNSTCGLATPSRGATDLSVVRQRQQPGGNNPAHSHDREEVMIMLSGEVALTLDGEARTLAAGDVAIIPPATSHQIQNHGDACAEWLLAAPSGIRFFHASGEEAFPDWSR